MTSGVGVADGRLEFTISEIFLSRKNIYQRFILALGTSPDVVCNCAVTEMAMTVRMMMITLPSEVTSVYCQPSHKPLLFVYILL